MDPRKPWEARGSDLLSGSSPSLSEFEERFLPLARPRPIPYFFSERQDSIRFVVYAFLLSSSDLAS